VRALGAVVRLVSSKRVIAFPAQTIKLKAAGESKILLKRVVGGDFVVREMLMPFTAGLPPPASPARTFSCTGG
jgi:hypothetical protein